MLYVYHRKGEVVSSTMQSASGDSNPRHCRSEANTRLTKPTPHPRAWKGRGRKGVERRNEDSEDTGRKGFGLGYIDCFTP